MDNVQFSSVQACHVCGRYTRLGIFILYNLSYNTWRNCQLGEVRFPTVAEEMDSLLKDVVWDDDGEYSQEPRNIMHYNGSTGKLYVF